MFLVYTALIFEPQKIANDGWVTLIPLLPADQLPQVPEKASSFSTQHNKLKKDQYLITHIMAGK